jgi:hypothetical protein
MGAKRDFDDRFAPSSGAGERGDDGATLKTVCRSRDERGDEQRRDVRHGEWAVVGGRYGAARTGSGGAALGRAGHKLRQPYGFEFVELTPEQAQRIA